MIVMIEIAMIDAIVMTEMIVTTGEAEMTDTHDGKSSKSVVIDWLMLCGLLSYRRSYSRSPPRHKRSRRSPSRSRSRSYSKSRSRSPVLDRKYCIPSLAIFD